ncbi:MULTISPECIES: caspase domain-containing protein [Rhodomicrobium]|uniref:caspase family protein n=1 Tax=Rhodomicrobium TaxID=1068 RepID=UPI000B4AD2EF|nr:MULTISPECIES: caspase domain-containing protein [Rhodomicrobium]
MAGSQPLVRLIFVFLILVFAGPAEAARTRTALVIGNSAYQHTEPLRNPRNDAAEVAARLRRLGFQVFEGLDLSKSQMDEMVKAYAVALETSEAALFYYAGHGLQINDRNFLIPVDAELKSPAALEFEMIRLDQIQAIMERLTETNILVMDACRNNPLSRNLAKAMGTRSVRIGTGLAPSESGAGTLIAYSTQPGSVAMDGEGAHSPFTEALLKFIDAKGEDLSSILINVRNDVMRTTYRKQIPWEHSALSQRFYFVPPDGEPPPPAPEEAPAMAGDPRLELELWTAVKDSSDAQTLKTYLDRFPRGTFSGLAALRIAELERKTAALAPAAAGDLGEKLQAQLKRVGCYAGAVDGAWGEASKAALAAFARARGGSVQPLEPSEATLAALTRETGRVCPLQCRAGAFERDGVCVARERDDAPAPAAKRRARPRDDDDDDNDGPPARAQARKREPKPKFELCMDSRNLIVDCNDGSVVLRR